MEDIHSLPPQTTARSYASVASTGVDTSRIPKEELFEPPAAMPKRRVIKPVSEKAEMNSGFRTLYSDLICEVLDISLEQYSMITVKYSVDNGRLIQVGYHHGEDPPLELQEYRGVVIDTKARIKVCPGSEYTEVIALKSPELDIQPLDSENPEGPSKIVVHSNVLDKDVDFEIDTDDTLRCRYYSNGVNLKVFLHNGRVYVITNRNLDASGEIADAEHKERWNNDPAYRETHDFNRKKRKAAYGENPAFTDLFHELLGFDVKDLYPAGCLYSPYTYSFLMTVPHLVNATRLIFPKKGYLTFIRKESTWLNLWRDHPDLCPFKDDSDWTVDEETTFHMGTPDLYGIDVTTFFKEKRGDQFVDDFAAHIGDAKKESFIVYPRTNLSIEQANRRLRYGFESADFERYGFAEIYDQILEYSPERNFIGEAIILTKKIQHKFISPITGQEKTREIYYSVQLQPPGYAWRFNFLNEGDGTRYPFRFFLNAISVYMQLRDQPTYKNLTYTYPPYDVREFAAEKYMQLLRANPEEEQFWVRVSDLRKTMSTKDIADVFIKTVLGDPKENIPPHSFFMSHIMRPVHPKSETLNLEYEGEMLDAILPYVIMIMNPSRQYEMVRCYQRYRKQRKMLIKYCVAYMGEGFNKGGAFYDQEGRKLVDLQRFCQAVNKASTRYGAKNNNIADIEEFIIPLTKAAIERLTGEQKNSFLTSVALKIGRLEEVMQITNFSGTTIPDMKDSYARKEMRRQQLITRQQLARKHFKPPSKTTDTTQRPTRGRPQRKK